jgi:hypothetical protein
VVVQINRLPRGRDGSERPQLDPVGTVPRSHAHKRRPLRIQEAIDGATEEASPMVSECLPTSLLYCELIASAPFLLFVVLTFSLHLSLASSFTFVFVALPHAHLHDAMQ